MHNISKVVVWCGGKRLDVCIKAPEFESQMTLKFCLFTKRHFGEKTTKFGEKRRRNEILLFVGR